MNSNFLILTHCIKPFFLILLLSFVWSCANDTGSTVAGAPVELRVGEGFKDPIGYYEKAPRFSWKIQNGSNIQHQLAYQIQVASSRELLFQQPDLWESGKVISPENSWVRYQGHPLTSRQQVFWRVRIWGQASGISEWSEVSHLELGLLKDTDWQAQWIGHPDTSISKTPSKALLATPQYVRKTFTVRSEAIQKARLYVSSKGLFKAYANGKQVAPEDVMTPGWTPYHKRVEVLTYDVKDMLTDGENVLAATIAGGWYAMRVADLSDIDHRHPARFIAQLEITYASGETDYITTDENWQVTLDGPIRFASIYDGEHYDASKILAGWSSAGYQSTGAQWAPVLVEELDTDVLLTPKRHAPVREIKTISAKTIISAEEDHEQGVVVFDFGQNMVGVPQLNLPGVAGKELKVRFAEALHKGEFYTDNYRSALSTNIFIPSKTGLVTYKPTFTYHGYRYIEISGFDSAEIPELSWVSAIVQHSDFEVRADFNSSHAKLNQLSKNIEWGMRSNFYDIPLDCPQRDERLGWTGDAQVFATPSMYMADVYGFWAAWLQSIREEQQDNGMIPLYIPFVEWINWPSSGWGDAVTIIPWELYMATGDLAILQDNYAMMKRWLNYHDSQSTDFISSMMTFGDWLQPHPVAEGKAANRGDTDFSLISTAYYARSVQLTMKTAQVLGRRGDVESLELLHNNIKAAFRAKFFDDALDVVNGNTTQTSYLLGLAFELFDASERQLAEKKLISLIEQADWHLRTGFLGTPLLASVLQDAGRSDLVYRLIFNESYPSWFYSINNGATTTWERWNSYSLEDGFNPEGMNSLNHYAYGSISRWFYEGVLGIQALEPGFKRIQIAPQVGEQLSTAKGSYETPQGKVAVSWRQQGLNFELEVSIPQNTTAQLTLPNFEVDSLMLNQQKIQADLLSDLSPGSYSFQARLKR